MFSTFIERITAYMSGFYLPRIHVIDVVEILIIAVLLYFFINWIQRTRAYALLRGIVVIAVFIAIAYATQMTVILYIVQSVAQVALIAAAVIFQPELRKALETLGNKSFFSFLKLEPSSARTPGLADRTISEILRAVIEMSELRTGALIVFEQKILLTDYINTGIAMDSEVSSQLLVNIFEHNTPLHDGAVILRGDRVAAATCYLPLSDNAQISKRYGTRHRAGLGISEVSDSFTIIVSEETGRISCAYMGNLTTGVTPGELREQLHQLQKNFGIERSERKMRIWKGRERDER